MSRTLYDRKDLPFLAGTGFHGDHDYLKLLLEQAFVLGDDTPQPAQPWANPAVFVEPWAGPLVVAGAPAFDPAPFAGTWQPPHEERAQSLGWFTPEETFEGPAKPTAPAIVTAAYWGGGTGNVYHIEWTWPAGLGPQDVAITYQRKEGLGWTQNNTIPPDDYRNPSPGSDSFSTTSQYNFVDVMVRVVRRTDVLLSPMFGPNFGSDGDPVMQIGDPVPAEAWGYASNIVRIFTPRPAVWGGAGEEAFTPAPFLVLPDEAFQAPFTPAAGFDPAPVVPALGNVDVAPAAAGNPAIDELAAPIFPNLPNAPTMPLGPEQEPPATTWAAYVELEVAPLYPNLPNAPTFPLHFDPELPSTQARWFQPDDDWLGIPPFAITTASVAEQAALWPEQPGQERATVVTWFRPDDAGEGLVPQAPAFDPAVVASLGFDELHAARSWGVPYEELIWTPTPPFAPSTASVAEQAALWEEQPGQDRFLQPVWWRPDDAGEGLTPPAPPIDPASQFPWLFDPELPARRDPIEGLIDAESDGGLAAWLHLVWGGCPPTTGATPAILIDATTGDPYIHLDGPFIARVD